MQIYWTKINQIIDETPEIKTYMLDCPEGFTWEEGAHTHFAFEGFNAGEKPDRSIIRHMSISTLPHENAIGITTRIKDHCSKFKDILRAKQIGDEVAIFKTHSNVPLKREDKNVYLLSSGVGAATFRPLVLDYLERADNVNQLHSLNIDSSRNYLFSPIFTSVPEKKFTSEFVDNRQDYYNKVKQLSVDEDNLFYIVGSDEFIKQNIEVLQEKGVQPEQIMLDKHENQLPEFFNLHASI